MLRRVSMTTCCSPLASHPRSSRGNILQHVSSMLMVRLRSVIAGIVRCPLDLLLAQISDDCGFQGAWAIKSGTGSPQRDPLGKEGREGERRREERERCACARRTIGVLFFAKRRHCVMVQSGLTQTRGQNHSFTSGGMSVLRRFLHGSAGLSSPTPSPAAAGSSPAGSVTAAITMSSLHDKVFCDCGHREPQRMPTAPPRWWLRPQLFDTAVHGVDELTETLSPFNASERPPNTTCPDTWPWEQKTCCLCMAPHETGILVQSSMTLRSRTSDKRGERALHGQRIALLQTIGLRNTERSS